MTLFWNVMALIVAMAMLMLGSVLFQAGASPWLSIPLFVIGMSGAYIAADNLNNYLKK